MASSSTGDLTETGKRQLFIVLSRIIDLGQIVQRTKAALVRSLAKVRTLFLPANACPIHFYQCLTYDFWYLISLLAS